MQELHFSVEIKVDGQLAARVTEDDAPLFVSAYRELWPYSLIETIDPKAEAKRREQVRQVAIAMREIFGVTADAPKPVAPEPVQPIVETPKPIEPVQPVVPLALPFRRVETPHEFAARLTFTDKTPDTKRFPLMVVAA
jgi:hypothetical protein